MRHRVYGKKLGRNKNERTLLFKSLVQSLLTYGTIVTSESKAKAIKGLVDKVINLAKSKNTERKNTQRLLQAYLTSKDLQERLIKEIAPKLDDRISGYTTLLKLGARAGDKTMMVRMSLIHNEELKPLEKFMSKARAGALGKRLQGTVKKTEVAKKPVVKKATPVKKVAAKKITTRRRTSKK